MGRQQVAAALYAALRVLDRLLQVLLPARHGRVCYTSIPDYTDNAYYLYRHAVRHRRDLEHIWLIRDPEVGERIRREFDEMTADLGAHGHRLRVLDRWSLRGYLAYLRSRHAFHTHGVYAFSTWSLRRHVVCLWHGMPIKAIGHLHRTPPRRTSTFGTTHLATSHLFRYVIACAFEVPAAAVELHGLPRVDALRYADARATSPSRIRQLLDIPDDKRLVLWMPTYRTQSTPEGLASRSRPGHVGDADRPPPRSFLDDLEPWTLPALDEACAEQGCVVVVKLHPFDVLNHDERPLEAEHLRVVTASEWAGLGAQLYDLIAASDALVSDVSSVLLDYLATTRPIALLGFSEADYDRRLLLPLDVFTTSRRFHALSSPDEVARFLEDVRAARDCSAPANDVASLLYEEPGRSASEGILADVGL